MREQGRAPGRGIEVRASVGRTALFSLVVVGLSIGMLTLAGTTPLGIGRAVENPSRVRLDQRTFSCAGGIDAAKVRSGSVRNGLDPVSVVGTSPTTIVADRDVAATAFAGQQAVSKNALAWLPCPEPRARWWFVGAGGAAVTHDTVLTLSNPRTGEASVDIDVYGPDGRVDAPDFRNIPVPAQGSRVIDLAKTAPAVGNLAVSVVARRGLVSVSAVDRFAPGTLGKSEREWLPAQSLPGREITLAGIPAAKNVASTLVVVNPNAVDAIVKVAVIGTGGTFTPEGMKEFIVGPHKTASLSMATVVDGSSLAVRVSSPQPVTATLRSVKDGDPAFATGVGVVRGGTSFAVPDGTGQLVISSLKTGATMRVVAYNSAGAPVLDKTVKVAARTSVPVNLPGGTRFVRLVADAPDLVAGFTVFGKHGVTSAGVTSSIRSIRLPKVRPAW